MRSNFGWPMVLTRSLSVGAVLAWATTAAWGQLSNPNPNRPEPTPAPTNTAPTNNTPTADPAMQAGQVIPGRLIPGQVIPGQAGHTTDAPIQEATGTGPVLGAHFEHGVRGAQTELKIKSIDPNSPASQAGLQPNDQLVAIDGRTFANPRQLIAYLSVLGGRPVPVVYHRNGREMTTQLVAGQFQGDHAWLGVLLEENQNGNDQNQTFQNPNGQNPNGPGQNGQGQNGQAQNAQGQNGPGQNTQASGRAPTAPGSENKNAVAEEKGAEISQVYPNGPAARAGLRSGDVITQVNGQKVDDAAELVALIHEMKPQAKADFDVIRDNKSIKVPVTLGSRNQEYTAQFAPGQNGQNQFGPGQNGPGQGGPQYGPQNGPQQFPQGPGQWQGGQWQGPGQGGQFQGQAGFNGNEMNQLTQQNQRIADELKQLREEIKQLREQLQKK
jgi:S1-C subfamily serine protease